MTAAIDLSPKSEDARGAGPSFEGRVLTVAVPLRLSAWLVGGHALGSEVCAAAPLSRKIVVQHLNELVDSRPARLP